ncbi:MAG TPA: CHAT domain-containing protein [Acidobacteriota bacterium]|nr:CHAT domain-containing protein [Acidobacteriota bacterium]
MRQHLHTAIIELSGRDTISYQYMCRDGDASPPLAMFRKDFLPEEIRDSASSLMQALQCIRLSPDRADELKLWGGRLYDALIPEDLGESLQSEEPGDSALSIYLDPALAWIPWELLWDGDEFLCWRFQMGRLLQKSGSELRAANERLRGRRSGRGALIVFGSTKNLDATGEKSAVEEELRKSYGATNVWFYSAHGAVDILDELKKDYEICHFIGHGQFDREFPERSGWCFADGSVLDCRSIERVSSRASFPYLVFANSCYSACPNIADAHEYVTSLYRAFLNQGVPHYIGTIVPVPDAPSKVFALNFYKLLADGLSIGEALSRTRRAFADLTDFGIWSSYVHYGDPSYRLLASREAGTAAAASEGEHGRWGATRNQTSFSVLGRLSSGEIHRMLQLYKSAIARNPADGEAYFALGLSYLQLQLYDLSIKNFKQTIELMPDYADGYYYYALSLVRGRKPKLLSLTEVKRMEEYLRTAQQLDGEQSKYLYLQAILKQDYYLANGLICNPFPEELLCTAEHMDHDPWEAERLLQHVQVEDFELVSRVRRNDAALKR